MDGRATVRAVKHGRLPVLGALLTLTACGAATAKSGAAHLPCGPGSGRTLAAGKLARVYSLHGSVYGCAAGGKKSYSLGLATRSVLGARVGPVVVAGDMAAYGLTAFGVDTAPTQVIVRRLTDGKRLASGAATDRPMVEGYEAVDSLVLRSDGAVAWIGESRSLVVQRGAAIEVRKIDASGAGLLDSGSAVRVGSLRLHGATLSWQHGTATRHAALR
jgi:hypothetical protein